MNTGAGRINAISCRFVGGGCGGAFFLCCYMLVETKGFVETLCLDFEIKQFLWLFGIHCCWSWIWTVARVTVDGAW